MPAEASACPLQAWSGGKQSIHINGTADCADCWETAPVNGDIVEFDRLAGADLVLDRVYRGGTAGGTRDDPLCKLLPVGNQGGFRPSGSPTKNSVKLTVLYTTGEEADWPDALDPAPVHSPTTAAIDGRAGQWRIPPAGGTCC
jgi:hypothetical protein